MRSDVHILSNDGWDERIWAFQYKRIVTNYAVISSRYIVLIDTLVNQTTAGVMLSAVRDALRNGRQLLVINTHADWDHCWGNAAFAGPDAQRPTPIIGHRLCRERMLSAEAQIELGQMQADYPQTFDEVRIEPPTLTFDGQFMIDGDDLSFELIPTPGHTPDHISVFVPQIRTLFAGDAAEAPLPLVSNALSLPDLRASLERLLALDPETVFYCHAPDMHSPDLLHANIAYLDELDRRAAAALASNQVPEQIETADVEALIGYPFEEVPDTDALEPKEYAFYRDGHQAAIRATLDHLRQ